jgi:hypothetical protein
VIEGLLWIQKYLDHNPNISVKIIYDSEYAAKSIQGIYNGKKNRDIIIRGREIYHQVREIIQNHGGDLIFEFVKGHNGAAWNERADFLATTAAKTGNRCNVGRYASEVEAPGSTAIPSKLLIPSSPRDRKISSPSSSLVVEMKQTQCPLSPPPPSQHPASSAPEPVSQFNKITTTIAITTTTTTTSLSREDSTVVDSTVTHQSELTFLTSFSYQTLSPLSPYLAHSKRAQLSMRILEEEVIASFEYDSRVIDILRLFPHSRYSPWDKTWIFPMRFIGEIVEIWKRLGGVVDDEMEEMARRRGKLRKRDVPWKISFLLSSPSNEKMNEILQNFPPLIMLTILKHDDLLAHTSQLIARLSEYSPNQSSTSSSSTEISEKFQNLLNSLNIPSEYLNPLQQQHGGGNEIPRVGWVDLTLKGFYHHCLKGSSQGGGEASDIFLKVYHPTSCPGDCDPSDQILSLLSSTAVENASPATKRNWIESSNHQDDPEGRLKRGKKELIESRN